jgi:hypothetical protein
MSKNSKWLLYNTTPTNNSLKSSVTCILEFFGVQLHHLNVPFTNVRFDPFLSASTHADVSRSCYFKAQHLQLLQAEFLGYPPRRYSSAIHSEAV